MPHTPSSRNTPDCASFRTDVARRAPRFRVATPPAPLPRSPTRARLAAVRRPPRPLPPLLLAPRPVDRSRPQPPRRPAPPRCSVIHPFPTPPPVQSRHSPIPPPTCCVPRSPPAHPLHLAQPIFGLVEEGGHRCGAAVTPFLVAKSHRRFGGVRGTQPPTLSSDSPVKSPAKSGQRVGGNVGAGVERNRLGRREEPRSSAACAIPRPARAPSPSRQRSRSQRSLRSFPREPEPAEEAHPPGAFYATARTAHFSQRNQRRPDALCSTVTPTTHRLPPGSDLDAAASAASSSLPAAV